MIDIAVKDLVKSFEIGDNLLDGLSFQVQEGECVAILGRNGCGKTTLFRILTGEIGYDQGEVYVNPGKRLGLISQIPRYPQGSTVEDVLRSAFRPLLRMRRRMAEIGVRKAFGATANELMRQVFLENLLLTCLAGLLGLALSYAATFVLNGFLFGNSTNAYLAGETSLTAGALLSPWIFLAAFLFCLLMNLLSAGIPAWRASRMNIVEAINGKR